MPISPYRSITCQTNYNHKTEFIHAHSLFSRYFEVLEANNSDKLLNEVYALRYQVYCLENPFEDASCFSNQKEKDIFDKHSLHVLIRHRGTGEAIATVRLVLPDSSNPAGQLPIETCCSHSINATQESSKNSSPHLPAEISRFAISKNARQRIIDIPPLEARRIGKSTGDFTHWSRLLYSHLTLELVAAAMQLSHDHGITHWYSLATPALIRALKRFGIQITPIRPPIEHRGKRYPCLDKLETLLAGVYQKYPDAWTILTKDRTLWPESAHGLRKNKNRYPTPHTPMVPWQLPPAQYDIKTKSFSKCLL